MPINFADTVYAMCQNTFGRPVTVTPLASQPGNPAYAARGIWSSDTFEVEAEEGSVFSDQKSILDILDKEFLVKPLQGDHISIPDVEGIAGHGDFVIIDEHSNGEGETTLTLRRIVPTKP